MYMLPRPRRTTKEIIKPWVTLRANTVYRPVTAVMHMSTTARICGSSRSMPPAMCKICSRARVIYIYIYIYSVLLNYKECICIYML